MSTLKQRKKVGNVKLFYISTFLPWLRVDDGTLEPCNNCSFSARVRRFRAASRFSALERVLQVST